MQTIYFKTETHADLYHQFKTDFETMKLFQSIRKFYQEAGIQPPQPNQNYSFQWNHFFCIFFLIQLLCSTMAFILFEAKSVVEYAEAFFPSSTVVAALLNFIVCILENTNILQLIVKFEEFIEKSKFYSCSV